MWTGWRKKVSFKSKLLIGISSIIFFTVNLSGLISYLTHLRLFEEEVTEQYVKASEQAMMQLELRIMEMYRISNYIAFNPTIEKIMTRLSSPGEEVSLADRHFDQERIAEQLRQVKFDAPQLLSLYLYDLTGTNYYYSLMKEAVEPLGEAAFCDVYGALASSNGELVWMRRAIPSQIEKSGYRDVIIASRWMKAGHGKTYGLLVMVIDEPFLTRSFREIGSGGDGRVYLFDQRAALLYTDGSAEEAEGPERLLIGTTGSKMKDQGDTTYFYTSAYSKEILFTLVSRVSLSYIFQDSRLILNISLWLGLLSICLSSLLIVLLSGRLLSPLKELVRAMRTMREGDFEIRIRSRSNDELGYLGESFNAMAASVQDMIQKVYVSQISEREAELKALQAQLNPHFLYNTLNGLYWKLYLQNDMDTANLVFSLSRLLKYSLERIHHRTTLREELEQVENYLRIQEAFLENGFDARIRADEDVCDCEIQRLLLQPLVENAFVHAFKDRTSSKVLEIRACRIDDFLKIEIEDNGCGMSKEQVDAILAPGMAGERDSLGVQSVLRRINLVYGQPYRLEIASVADQGTTVHLYLPLRGEEGR
ncbi:cache domain-containing sensor histidine kinase [Paenibacillus arenilitoris]|uniref:Sensor histidine kinase n=1 Tax=Paenibacillus arenilitoris TaxID=2772299 RepID=A0A927CH00_9BACL|nr:sensor histidine kinase [Paenibacillus arenilitoris]MBD2867324.1 sensor histidine kinase [Paenibacillus arenilitoris]